LCRVQQYKLALVQDLVYNGFLITVVCAVKTVQTTAVAVSKLTAVAVTGLFRLT
jgi:hypothetical protein